MKDSRMVTLAKNLVTYSCGVKPGENVLIENTGLERDFVAELVRQVYEASGHPFVQLSDAKVNRALYMGATKEQVEQTAKYEAARMSEMQAYIGLRSGDNSSEMSGTPQDKLELYSKYLFKPVHSEIRVPKTKWVVLRYPTPSMAQQAGMSTDDFEDYYFNVCCLDYRKMSDAMDKLVDRMERTDAVRLTGRDTDLTFSIKGLPSIKCAGEVNIPDGEVFSAPVKDSVNGKISFNTPSLNSGFTFESITLEFKDGKIIKASANDTKRVNDVLDTDEGARYVGEFAIGVNPYITKPMKDTLFDEKIAGSFHFTPGSCYDECDNGNKSAIHWDLVFIQTPEFGGGEMYFDGELVRKDGLFVTDDLLCLNPEALK